MESRDLNLLAALDAILQEGSVTGAARRLGLSTPAASHALGRIRARFGDPILVRAGRKMVLTPRAEGLRAEVRGLVEQAQRLLDRSLPFTPGSLERSFTVFTTDHVLLVLGPVIDRILREEAPGVSIRYLPSVEADWIPLRDGSADLSVCVLGHFPDEFRTRQLFTDRFVCVLRQGHPRARRLTLDDYLALQHIAVAPLGRPSQVDAALAARGLKRRVRRTVPYFLSALLMAAESDDLLTVSDRAALALAPHLGLRLLPPPLPLEPYALHLLWHPRRDEEPANAWLRSVFVRAAEEAAPEKAAPGSASNRTIRSRSASRRKTRATQRY